MKKYFYVEESAIGNGYLVKPSFDLLPLHYTMGSFSIVPARLLNISYANFLRLCRDDFNGKIKGKNYTYPMVYFAQESDAQKLSAFLNERADSCVRQDTFIDEEYLKAHAPCDMGFSEFTKRYPNGEFLLNILENPKTPKHWLFWGHEHLTLNEAQEEAYAAAMKIKDSYPVYQSYNVQNSTFVTNSHSIKNSHYVADSKIITDSALVRRGRSVSNSTNIYNSQGVEESSKIFSCLEVKNSKNCSMSKVITNSTNIFSSEIISNSYYVSHSIDLEWSKFCSFCEYSKALLFCYGLKEEELRLFNKPISYSQYKEISLNIRENWKNLELSLAEPVVWDKTHLIGGEPNLNYIKHYNLSDDFISWVQSLPNFDPIILYQITYKKIGKEEQENG